MDERAPAPARSSDPREHPQAAMTAAAWARVRGRPVRGIPVLTYNLHPFGRHGADASYAPLLEKAACRAGMLIKHEPERTGEGDQPRESTVERCPEGTRRTVVWHTPRGPLRSVSLTPPGQPGYTIEPFVKSEEDMARVLSVPPPRPRFDMGSTHRFLAALGGRGILYVSYPDPMYAAASLFSAEDFAVWCITDPGGVQALIDHQAEAAEACVESLAAAAAGMPLLFYTAGPEVATPPLLSPALFGRFVTPYQKRLIGIFHRHGHCAAIHCHGRVGRVLDEILETGVDALEPIEPPPQGDIGLRELLDRTRGRLCLIGHIQDQDFFRDEPGLMRRRVAEIARAVDPAERYVMAPTCTPFQFPASPAYVRAYGEWLDAAGEALPPPVTETA